VRHGVVFQTPPVSMNLIFAAPRGGVWQVGQAADLLKRMQSL